jgi:hypothetical protein
VSSREYFFSTLVYSPEEVVVEKLLFVSIVVGRLIFRLLRSSFLDESFCLTLEGACIEEYS